jgi:2-dehydro-3-deoxyphosphogluconate aldolase / (4S)-4-hydroxy-2-oxoglutarate aldolase
MATKEQNLERVSRCGVVAIVRTQSSAQLVQVAEAIKAGGIDVLEFTMTTPNALQTISAVADKMGDSMLLGAGTVLDPETARAAILAGAKFLVTPTLNPKVIQMANRYSIVTVVGTFTPTEMLTAWEAGADVVKLFPATVVGPKYIKDVHGPLPQLKIIPTGGVDLNNCGEFVKAGAFAVAVGGNLVDKKAIEAGNFDQLTQTAKQFGDAVRLARGVE